jgi:hypothetical protein
MPVSQPVLELLPAVQRAKVMALLGYNPISAGGLMGLDFLALSRDTPVAAALERVRTAHTLQPEALTTIFSLDEHQRLRYGGRSSTRRGCRPWRESARGSRLLGALSDDQPRPPPP